MPYVLAAGLLHDTDQSGWQAWLAAAGCATCATLAGPVFQDFNLLDTFSVKDNIFLPLVLSRKSTAEMEKRLAPIAKQLGISELLYRAVTVPTSA